MKLYFLPFFLLFGTILYSQNNIDWAKSLVGDGDDVERDIDIDQNGNVYTSGSYRDTLWDFESSIFALTAENSVDGFFSKRDSQGTILWLKALNSSGNTYVNAISVDNASNVVITGWYTGTMDLDPGNDTQLITSYNSNPDIFIAKYDSSGDFLWGHSIGGAGSDSGVELGINNSNEIIVVGNFHETVDFDPSINGTSTETAVNKSAFILKLDSSGGLVWEEVYAASGLSYSETSITDLSIDMNGNISLLGRFSGELDFDLGTGEYLMDTYYSSANGAIQIFNLKLTGDGDFIFAGKHDSFINDNIPFAIVNDDMGNTFYTGYFRDDFDIDPTPSNIDVTSVSARDAFVVKIGPTGTLEWYKILSPTTIVDGAYPADLSIDSNGDLYCTGVFGGSSLDFAPENPGQIVLPSSKNAFICKIDGVTGNTDWAVGTNAVRFKRIKNQGSNYFYTLGFHGSEVDIDHGSGQLLLPHEDMKDIFVAKYKTCFNSSVTISETACSSYLSPSGEYNWTTSGVYTDTILNVAGCDSIITIDLTINLPQTVVNTVYLCEGDSFTAADGSNIENIYSNLIDTTTIVSSNLCDSTIITNINLDIPDTTVSLNSGVLFASASNTSFQWIDCNNGNQPILGEDNQEFTPSSNGIYSVIVGLNSCFDTSACWTYDIVNLEEDYIFFSPIKLFPNPTNGKVTIQLGHKVDNVYIVLKNALGQIVGRREYFDTSKVTTEINGESGFYFIELIFDDSSKVYPIIKN